MAKIFKDVTVFVFSYFGHWDVFDIWNFAMSMKFNKTIPPGDNQSPAPQEEYLLLSIVPFYCE